MANLLFPPRIGVHNAPYPNLNAQQSLVGPVGSVGIVSGTYAGNNTGQDINTGIPVHWLWIRPLTGSITGARWWSSMDATHDNLTRQIKADRMVQALVDPSGNNVFRVAGVNAATNATGTTYQWVGVSDPTMRYIMNGQFSHVSTVASYANPLIDPSFTPESLFFWVESLPADATTGFWFKGLGQGTDIASKVDSTQSTGVMTIAKGLLTSTSTIHLTDTQPPDVSYNCWRRNDGNGTGLFDLVTYTGDGTGARSITCSLGGKSPLFAFIQPHNGIAYFRDPSHATTHSTEMDGTDSTTGIVGGDLNTVKINSALNSNAVVYDMFVLPGNVNAGAWSGNISGVFYPVPTIVRPNVGGFSQGLPFFAPGTPQWVLNRLDIRKRKEQTG